MTILDQQMLEYRKYCEDCDVQAEGENAVDINDDQTLIVCSKICNDCLAGSNWTPRPGDERMMPDLSQLKIGDKLVDEECFSWIIRDIERKKCVPAKLFIECDDLIGTEWIDVSMLVYYDIEYVGGGEC